MVKVTSQGEFQNIVAIGGKAEIVPLSQADVTTPIAHGANWTSGLLIADGFQNLIVGVTSSKAGALNVQRYIDDAGQVPIGAADTVALVAATAKVLKIADGVPFGSYTVQITNTDGADDADITAFAMRQTS